MQTVKGNFQMSEPVHGKIVAKINDVWAQQRLSQDISPVESEPLLCV